jgi:protein-S-isoprenylcysteine O-methyltransferase Ste14
MTTFDWAVTGFVIVAIVERLWEVGFSKRAVRGDVKMRWSLMVFYVLHAGIFLGTLAEYWAVRRGAGVWWLWGVAVVLWMGATWLRLTAIRALGRFWSLNLEIRAGHQLVKEGVYSRIRHPAYTAIMMEVVALPLSGGAWWMLGVTCVYIGVLLLRWSKEEREMEAKFGEEYVRYRQQAGAFWPRL